MRKPLLIVGASGRAAAASAIRAGYDPFVIDLFADADTQRLCPVLKCDPADYPHGFIPLAKKAPTGPWMYTGGLENYSEVVEAISQGRELWGNGRDVLRFARDQKILGDKIRKGGGQFPTTIEPGSIPHDGKSWLMKPTNSSGGSGIRYASAADFEKTSKGMRFCLQQFVTGDPMSAIFQTRKTDKHYLFGLTRQLIGIDWLHARRFQYTGNISRVDTDNARSMRISATCFNGIGLRFVWCEDFIRMSQGRGPFTVEVNPRYTAGMEVLEHATGVAILAEHWEELPELYNRVGKAIYYAPLDFTFPASGPWDNSLTNCTDVWKCHDYADISHAGSRIEKGQPVITIFAQGGTEADCLQSLQRRAAELDRLFGAPAPGELP